MPESEVEFLDRVVDALGETFPLVAEEDIRARVVRAHRRFADATVRIYVPVLVLRRVRAELMLSPSAAVRGPRPEAVG